MFSTIDQSPQWEPESELSTASCLSPLPSHTMVHDYHPNSHYSPGRSTGESVRTNAQSGWFPLASPDIPPLSLAKNPYGESENHQSGHHHRSMSIGGWEHDTMTHHPNHHPRSVSMGWEHDSGPSTPFYPMYSSGSYDPTYTWQQEPLSTERILPSPINTDLSHRRHVLARAYSSSSRSNAPKELSVGRWTDEEHRIFVKGLQIYQGPAWAEIARMIGTRTSIQVRTHAQKFFTKLARTNQLFPYFEAQIQKERSRLVAQGELLSNHSNVTPTSMNLNVHPSLSPPRKRGMSMSEISGLSHKRNDLYTSTFYGGPSTEYIQRSMYPESQPQTMSNYARPHMSSVPITSNPYYVDPDGGLDPSGSVDLYRIRRDSITGPDYAVHDIRKSRVMDTNNINMYSPRSIPSSYGEQRQPQQSLQLMTSSPYSSAMNTDWEATTPSRPWMGTSQISDMNTGSMGNMDDPQPHLQVPADPDSLPSVNKLLYRGSTST